MRKVTIKDVASEAGVSTATVSRVINKTYPVSEPVKERVAAAIRQLNYRPNAIARDLKTNRTNTVGIIVPDISNPYFMKISKGIEDVIHQEGYNLLFGSGDESPEKEKELLYLLYEKRVDAIVVATSGDNGETISRLSDSGIPLILIDRRVRSRQTRFDLVAEDNTRGAYLLTRSLLEQGHTRVGIINGNMQVSTAAERYDGFLSALSEVNGHCPEELVYNGSFSTKDGKRAVRMFFGLAARPTALLSFNNAMTMGALLELADYGDLLEDVLVASYGYVDAARFLPSTRFIYVRQDPYRMGIKAGSILLERMGGKGHPKEAIFEPKIETLGGTNNKGHV